MLSYKNRILIAVVGLSPQVITETLFALSKEKPAFIPTEIHLITTEVGARLVKNKLLNKGKGQYHKLQKSYPKINLPPLSKKHIHIVQDKHQQPLTDIRTIEDNNYVADTITLLLAKLTNDPNSILHVSIAGGRKTMGFYLGYIFSLFARPQDQLSHVLINEPFENHPDFYFPPKKPKKIKTHCGQLICTSQAKITLAKIPVVKLRYIQTKEIFSNTKKFSNLVKNLQESYKPPSLLINIKKQEVICGSRQVKLAPALLAWFILWAKRTKKELPPANWRDIHAKDFLRIYAKLVGKNSASYVNTSERLADGMDRKFFRQNNSKLKRNLEMQLGPSARHYLLNTHGKRPYTKYALKLQSKEITLF